MDEQAWFQLWSYAPTATSAAFTFAFGACVGSFLNVVCYRLPAGMSLTTPPSRCSSCGRRLRWFENLPVIGWMIVRGRCRSCGATVSIQYPLVELLMGLLFAALYLLLFGVRPGPGIGGATTPWWSALGGVNAAPGFIALLALVAGMVAAAIIDSRTFLIPIEITSLLAGIGFIAWPLQAALPPPPRVPPSFGIPLPEWPACWVALMGGVGLAASWLLLRIGLFKPSYADYDSFIAPGETLADYPHARRETFREILYLLPCVSGAAVAWVLASGGSGPRGEPPPLLQAFCGSLLGFMAGGGLLWGIRILGTLAFGREAMGMGDVHLMAAAGAILGWVDPLVAFFAAIFIALGWTIASAGWAAIWKRKRREVPLGPHLAVGVLLVIYLRPAFVELGRFICPMCIPAGLPGLFTNSPQSVAIPAPAAESAVRSTASPEPDRKDV